MTFSQIITPFHRELRTQFLINKYFYSIYEIMTLFNISVDVRSQKVPILCGNNVCALSLPDVSQ